jgi:hypothetical protein
MLSILVVEIYHIPTNKRVAMYPTLNNCPIEELFMMAWTKALIENRVFSWENKNNFRCVVKEL